MNDFVEIQGQGRMITVPKIHRQRVHKLRPIPGGRALLVGQWRFPV